MTKVKKDLEHFARSMATEQIKLDKATFLMCGPIRVDPNPVWGYPVCQFGCITTEPQMWFMKAYADVLVKQPSSLYSHKLRLF